VPERRSQGGQSRSLTVSAPADPQISQSACDGTTAPQTSQADSAGSVSSAHLALAVVIPVTPATGGARPHDGERGGRRGKEQEKKKEEDEQTPTPGAAPGLRPPRRRSGRQAAGELDRSPARRRAAGDQRRPAVTGASAIRWTGWPRRAPEMPRTAINSRSGRFWTMCPLLRIRWSASIQETRH
jgi:hypothetical protein